ncbi:hypothetical protein GDO81_025422 [Engystomops pustulosus]|uniref:Taste receptor type 2 n=1 Tax=Engystomops pustulosus TaxID=76066 RepID=A0AAV6YP20_ENGPU|nr:hypothetical protein GDO81_025422 [Engystomops pustulosus]
MSSAVSFGLLSLVELVVAITLNAGIIIIHMKGLRCGSKLPPVDIIHVAMGLVNISLATFLLGHFLGMSLSTFYPQISFHVTIIPLPFLMYFTFWLTAWLCAYYCTGINTSSHRLISWMKTCLRTSMPHLLVFSGLGSLAISLPAFWILHFKLQGQYSENGTFLGTSVGIGSQSIVYSFVGNLLGCFLPFIVILVSLITSVSSLVRHVWKIKQSDQESKRPKLRSHINALRTMVLLLILSGMFYTAETMLFNISSMEDNRIVASWSLIIIFPTAEAIIMIQASRNLRKIFLGAICPSKLVNNIMDLRTMNAA